MEEQKPEEQKQEGEKEEETVDALKEKLTQKEEELKTKSEELEKIKDKETNFGKLRKIKKQEEETLQEQIAGLTGQVLKLTEQLDGRDTKMVDDWKDTAITAISGDDLERKKAIQAEYDLLNMPTGSRDEVVARVKKAITLAGFEIKGDLASLAIGGSQEPEKKEKTYSETEKGKATARFLAPQVFAEKDRREKDNAK